MKQWILCINLNLKQKNNNKSNIQKLNKNSVSDRDKYNETSFAQTQKHEKVLLMWFRNVYVK